MQKKPSFYPSFQSVSLIPEVASGFPAVPLSLSYPLLSPSLIQAYLALTSFQDHATAVASVSFPLPVWEDIRIREAEREECRETSDN